MSVCISVSEGDNFFSASETREKMLGFFFVVVETEESFRLERE